jgi:hypothetical protein
MWEVDPLIAHAEEEAIVDSVSGWPAIETMVKASGTEKNFL